MVVFKYPLGAQTNFIKRAVGLPGETIRITHGDIFVRQPGEEQSTIARKPPARSSRCCSRSTIPAHLAASGRGHLAVALATGGEPRPAGPPRISGRFAPKAADRDVWLHYQHRVPSYEDWRAYLTEPKTRPNIKPQLISDFAAYNTESTVGGIDRHGFGDAAPPWLNQAFTAETARGLVATGPPLVPERRGQHWVSDLAYRPRSKWRATAVRCFGTGRRRPALPARIEVATGKATLSIPGLEKSRPRGRPLQAGGYGVMFANVDDQLRWVSGGVVSFDGRGSCRAGKRGRGLPLPERWRPQPADLEPVRIGSHRPN